MGEPVHLLHRMRPQLQDPNDEFVLETAFYGRAEAIVTFNYRDFKAAASKFGILALSPKEAVERMRNL